MKNKLISFLLAISIYFILIILILLYMITKDIKHIKTKKNSTILDVEMVFNSQSSVINKKIFYKKSSSVSNKKSKSMKSLFDDIKTNETSEIIAKKDVNTLFDNIELSRFKSNYSKLKYNDKNKKSNKIKSKNNKVVNDKNDNKVDINKDEYYDKIYFMLSSNWKPSVFDDSIEAVVVISIDKYGVFDYRFVSNSGNNEFDNQLAKYLDNQKTVIFPIYNNGSSIEIKISFKAKER